MKSFRLFILIVLIPSIVFTQSYIDIVKLKNGDIVKGKIIENRIHEYVRVELQGGSILTYEYSEIASLEVEKQKTSLEVEKPKNRSFGNSGYSNNQVKVVQHTMPQSPNLKDCYNDGFKSGQSSGGGGAMVGGVVGGLFLGLIGWGIAYLAVANSSPKPNYNELSSLDSNCQRDYSQGYKEGALKIKKTSVNLGGAVGTLLAIIIFTDSST